MVTGQQLGFGLSVLMVAIGVILCLASICDRRKAAEEQARRIADEIAKRLGEKEGITESPIPIGAIDEILKEIMKIENPFMQVGVFLTVFGVIVMVISIFLPF